jgi:hypothetical protein
MFSWRDATAGRDEQAEHRDPRETPQAAATREQIEISEHSLTGRRLA